MKSYQWGALSLFLGLLGLCWMAIIELSALSMHHGHIPQATFHIESYFVLVFVIMSVVGAVLCPNRQSN